MEGVIQILKKQVYMVLLFVFCAPHIQAAERFEFYNSVRSLGMGGARVAIVNDETALLVNPASLGKLRDSFFTLVDPELELGAGTQALIGTDVSAFMDPQKTLDLLNAAPNRRMHQRIQLFPSVVFKNFGIGVYGKYSMDAELNTAGTLMEMDYRNDFAVVFGFNFRIWDGRIKLGFNVKGVNRAEISRTDIDATSTNLTVSGLASEGMGIGSDLGLVMQAPWAWLPSIAAVYHDVGSTKYDLSNGLFMNTATKPVTTDPRVDVGLAVFPVVGKRNRMSLSAEYRDVLTYSDVQDQNRRIHYGVEMNFKDAFFIRGGMHQNQWSAGLELAMMNYQFQIATYGEEIGTAASPRAERRYVGKVVFRF